MENSKYVEDMLFANFMQTRPNFYRTLWSKKPSPFYLLNNSVKNQPVKRFALCYRTRCLLSCLSVRLSIHALVAKIQPDKVVRWGRYGDFFASFLHPVFPASRVQHVSDLHVKFALRSHHVWKYGICPLCIWWHTTKYSDFGLIEAYISEMVKDRR